MPKDPNGAGLFDELSVLQKASTEVMIWSNTVMQTVTIAYPVQKGERVRPAGVRKWLTCRGLHWPCFCSATVDIGETRSSRIVNAADGHTYIFCHEYPSRCNFFIDLTKIHLSALLESEFVHLPLKARHTSVPDMEELRTRFFNRKSATYEQNPYFEGFCGEHDSKYPGVEQACGATLYIAPARINASPGGPFLPSTTSHSISAPIRYAPYGRTPKGFVPNRGGLVAGPSRLRSGDLIKTSGESISERELGLLETLAHGNGIEEWDYQRFFEVCDGCGHFFLTGALSTHILKCNGKGKGKVSNI